MIVTLGPMSFKTASVLIDGISWRKMPLSLLKNCPLTGEYPSFKEWESLWVVWEKKTARLLAFNKLSRKRYFASELKTVLLRYGISSEILDPLIGELTVKGYLNDEDGIESMITRAIRESKGPLWIANQLRLKGITQKIQPQIENLYPILLRKERISFLFKKNKHKGHKAIASIIRRGFNLEEVLSVFNDF